MPLRHAAPIVLRGVQLGYDGRAVVENLDGTIDAGALLALVGPNGAGKSTLLKALAGLHRPMDGNFSGLGGRVAYMPQNSDLDRGFPIRLEDFVAAGLWHETGWWRPLGALQKVNVRDALARVGLSGLEDRRIGAISGGQLRRALFARITLQDAPLVLLDEPFAGIDTATVNDLLQIIEGWHAEGRMVIAALHDLDQVRAHFPDALLLAHKIVAWGPVADVLTDAHLASARALCQPDRETPRDV